jgi:predicted nucleotidyltransferase
MDRVTVVAKLRACESELQAEGIMRLSLFGSVARGDASSESDVDLMAEFDPEKQFSLLDMGRLENRLADILGVPVDLAPARAMKDRIRERATGRRCLPFEDEDGFLRDIADAIDMIERFTSGMGLEEFSEDPKTVAAVARKLWANG